MKRIIYTGLALGLLLTACTKEVLVEQEVVKVVEVEVIKEVMNTLVVLQIEDARFFGGGVNLYSLTYKGNYAEIRENGQGQFFARVGDGFGDYEVVREFDNGDIATSLDDAVRGVVKFIDG